MNILQRKMETFVLLRTEVAGTWWRAIRRVVSHDLSNYWPSDTALHPERLESSPQMYIPEMPVYLPDNDLSLAGGSDMSVLKF